VIPVRQLSKPRAYGSFREFFEDYAQQPFAVWSELETTHLFVVENAPELLARPWQEATERRQAHERQEAAVRAAREVPAASRPGRPRKGDKKEKCTLNPVRGNSREARTARLKRDHPAIAERLAAGEFQSVAAAVRASRGEEPHPPWKVPTPLEAARRAPAKLAPAELRILAAEVEALLACS